MRLLTYNVHSCVGTDGVYDVSRVGRAAASVNPDVVALQEVECNTERRCCRTWSAMHADDQPKEIAKLCGMPYVHFAATLAAAMPEKEQEARKGEVLHPSSGAGYGNAILSRFPIVDSRVLRYRDGASVRGRENEGHNILIDMHAEEQPRLALACLLDTPQALIWVVNTHFSHKLLTLSSEQSRQAHQCCDFIVNELLMSGDSAGKAQEDVQGRTCASSPVLLCGDFNSTPWFPRAAYRTVAARGGQDLWSAERDVVTCPTWYHSLRRPNLSWVYSGRIDHIFSFAKNIDCSNSSISCHEMFVVTTPHEAMLASDHCPVLADVQFRMSNKRKNSQV